MAGRTVVDVLADLGGDAAWQIGVDAGDQRRRDHRAAFQLIVGAWRDNLVRQVAELGEVGVEKILLLRLPVGIEVLAVEPGQKREAVEVGRRGRGCRRRGARFRRRRGGCRRLDLLCVDGERRIQRDVARLQARHSLALLLPEELLLSLPRETRPPGFFGFECAAPWLCDGRLWLDEGVLRRRSRLGRRRRGRRLLAVADDAVGNAAFHLIGEGRGGRTATRAGVG